MKISEIFDNNQRSTEDLDIILGQKVPLWPRVALFFNRTGFDFAQVCKLPNGKFFVDLGKENTKEYNYVGGLENDLRKRRMTEFEGIKDYRPSY